MITVPEITLERIQCARGEGEELPELARRAAEGMGEGEIGRAHV